MKTTILLSLSIALLAAGEAVPNSMIDPVARLGATGVLGFIVIWIVTRTAPAVLAYLKDAEKQRHEDSEKLVAALQDLRVHCEQAGKAKTR